MEKMPADPSTSDKPGAKTVIEIRKGQAPAQLLREEFAARFRAAFIDPAFAAEAESVGRLESIAWGAYTEGRKAPSTQKAGPGYADPDYDLSTEWVATKKRLDDAKLRWDRCRRFAPSHR